MMQASSNRGVGTDNTLNESITIPRTRDYTAFRGSDVGTESDCRLSYDAESKLLLSAVTDSNCKRGTRLI